MDDLIVYPDYKFKEADCIRTERKQLSFLVEFNRTFHHLIKTQLYLTPLLIYSKNGLSGIDEIKWGLKDLRA